MYIKTKILFGFIVLLSLVMPLVNACGDDETHSNAGSMPITNMMGYGMMPFMFTGSFTLSTLLLFELNILGVVLIIWLLKKIKREEKRH